MLDQDFQKQVLEYFARIEAQHREDNQRFEAQRGEDNQQIEKQMYAIAAQLAENTKSIGTLASDVG